jgi:hypothetical protein
MSVGAFPGLGDPRRRTIRAPVNPMDKSTVVSIYPKKIHEIKYTIQPGVFDINAGTYENPAILVVGPSSWWREIDEEQPLLEIPNSSIQVADSIVKDYCNGLLACNMKDCLPGLFYLPGEFTLLQIKKDRKADLDKAKAQQINWYQALVKMADTLWARTDGNPLVISDDMRLGARELGLTGKDWMKDHRAMGQVRCVACGSLRNPDYPICSVCKAIADPVKAKELGITFAQ